MIRINSVQDLAAKLFDIGSRFRIYSNINVGEKNKLEPITIQDYISETFMQRLACRMFNFKIRVIIEIDVISNVGNTLITEFVEVCYKNSGTYSQIPENKLRFEYEIFKNPDERSKYNVCNAISYPSHSELNNFYRHMICKESVYLHKVVDNLDERRNDNV